MAMSFIVRETRRLLQLKFEGRLTQAELERRNRELEWFNREPEEKEQLSLGIGAATEVRTS